MIPKWATVTFLLLFPVVTSAGMTSATLQISAQVVNNCVVKIPASVTLPAYSGMQVRSLTELQLKCTRAASPVVSLSSGIVTATSGAHVLAGPDGSQLAYQIYSDPHYNSVWNEVTEPPADGLTLRSYTLYWAIPSGQAVSPGAYANSLDVAVDPGTSIAKHYTIRVSSLVP
jgi:spore coat protein U-like protein